VKKDKIFFFWSQEWNKKIEGIRSHRTRAHNG